MQDQEHTCKSAVERLKKGPANYYKILPEYGQKGLKFTDMDFIGKDMVYWKEFADEFGFKWEKYDQMIQSGEMQFLRAGEVFHRHTGVTMWGNNDAVDWRDVRQGSANNCYLFSALGSLTERMDLLKKNFLVQELNGVGIYAFKFYIMGKPWIVTIDDYLPFVTDNESNGLKFGKLGTLEVHQSALWGPLIEKAWAKIKGSYANTNVGFVQNSLRALIGCPVVCYKTEDLDAD
jgi:hypothetical protein